MIALVLGALLAQAAATPGAVRGRMPATLPPVPPDAAVIRTSASTNTAGYTLVVAPDGTATVRQYDGFRQGTVLAPQTRWLFVKLRAAGPLTSLGAPGCIKSASFGTSTELSWNGVSSGDLTCATDPASRELIRTIGVIVRQLAIGTALRPRRLRPL